MPLRRHTWRRQTVRSCTSRPQTVSNFQSCEDQQGMVHRVGEIKDSWAHTGCSVLLDVWVNEHGLHRMNILVNCPKGTIYLRSYDITSYVGDLLGMQTLLNGIIDEIGESNVVQIIADSAEPSWIFDAGKSLMNVPKPFFWTLSASYCLEFILKEIAKIQDVEETLSQAKTITQFFHRDESTVYLMENHFNYGKDLVSKSKYEFARPFLTLEILFSEKNNLEKMIESYVWDFITTQGKEHVESLVRNESFWYNMELALKAASPIISVLDFVLKAAKPEISYLYEIMDRLKEKIQSDLAEEDEDEYKQYWKVIDEVWDNYLHNPLHAAAYRLNPNLYYNNNLKTDYEVESGIRQTVLQMVTKKDTQDQIYNQLDHEYRKATGSFKSGRKTTRNVHVSPAHWWSSCGEHCPQLQKFAIRILSQTCQGASKYGLERSLAEELLATNHNLEKKHRLANQAFFEYNLQLMNFNAYGNSGVTEIAQINPDDWIEG